VADQEELYQWAGGTTSFNEYVESAHDGLDVLKYSMLWLQNFEASAKAAKDVLEPTEAVEPIANVFVLSAKVSEAFEAVGMFALFLKDSGLSPFGIGSDPFEASVSGAPTANFVRELMKHVGVPPFLKHGNGGFWWDTADLIRQKYEDAGVDWNGRTGPLSHSFTERFHLEASVYEVSHCDHQKGTCGPGYGNEPGFDVVNNAGIQPELVFDLSLVYDGPSSDSADKQLPPLGQTVEQLEFPIQYDALAWDTTQPGMQGVIQDG
jgi:hypothetical protein